MQVSNSTADSTLAAGGPLPLDDSAPEGMPDASWRPLSDGERALVRSLGAQPPQATPGGDAHEVQLALAPGLRAARSRDDVMLQAQVQDAGGDWHTVTNAEARDGLLHVSDLDALRTAHGRSLPAAIVQSPEALPGRAPRHHPHASAPSPAVHRATHRTVPHTATRAASHPRAHRPPAAASAPATAFGAPRAGTARAAAPPSAAASEGLLAHAWHAFEALFGAGPAPAAPAAAPATQTGTLGPQALAQIEVAHRGHAYRESQVVRWSHYDNPIDRSAGRAAGNSRIWGDAPPATQAAAIDALVRASRAAHLDNHQTALVLAIARTESGFNPDAAAGTTSASGLGQFVDRTGTAYGLGNANRWNVDAQATALVHHFLDNQRLAQARHQGDEYIYKYHHDGPSADYGGLAISRREVMPRAAAYEALLNQRH